MPAVLLAAVILLAACGGQFGPRSAGKTQTHPTSSTTAPSSAPTSAPASTTPSTTAGSTTTTTAGPSLTHQNVSGVNVDIPTGWSKETIPQNISIGDHDDILFTDNADPNEQLLISVSDCVGCIQDGPGSLIPQGATNVSGIGPHGTAFSINNSAAYLSSYWSDKEPTALAPGDRTDGVVNVGSPTSTPTYAIVVVTLPSSQHDVAAKILNSVSIPAASVGNSGGSGQQSTTTSTPASTAPPANSAYQELQGTWNWGGQPFTFVPSGQPGQLTIAGMGGTATPTATQATFTGVNAGGGTVIVTYNFAQNPNTINIDADPGGPSPATRAG